MASPPFIWRDEGGSTFPKPDSVILCCFPGAGLAATVAAHYIVQALKMERTGIVDGADGLPVAVIQSGRVHPPIRVYSRDNLAVIVSEFPIAPSSVNALAATILDGVERKRSSLLLGLEGVIPHPVEEDAGAGTPAEHVWFAVARPDPDLTRRFTAAGARPLEDGVIGGVSGALLVGGISRKVPVALLLASARETEGYPDHQAAIGLIEALDRFLPEIQIDTKPLREQAAAIEKILRAAMEKGSKAAQRGRDPEIAPSIYQ